MIPEFTVRDGIWDSDTKIRRVERFRHAVAFRDNPEAEWEESSVMMCNNCGCPFSFGGGGCANCGYGAKE